MGKYLSPQRRLPLGIPMKIAIIEKQLAANDGKREKAGASPSSLFPLPIVPQALSFSFFPVSPRHKVDCEQSVSSSSGLVRGVHACASGEAARRAKRGRHVSRFARQTTEKRETARSLNTKKLLQRREGKYQEK